MNADPAEAATISVTSLTGSMANTAGYASSGSTTKTTTTSDCIRYGTNNGSTSGNASNSGGSNGTSPYDNGNTAAVSGGTNTAWTAHGASGSNCPNINNGVDLDQQSAIGIRPVAVSALSNAQTGQIFNLARMVHKNNPVQGGNDWFQGDMNISINSLNLTFRWQLNETPNQGGGNCCNDTVNFLNQVGSQTFTGSDGLTYTLVLIGFTPATGENSDQCEATQASVTPINSFSTVEGQITYGCLYAKFEQVRQITVIKQADTTYGSPTTMPSFAFTSSSSLSGAPWSTGFSLTPGATSTDRVTRAYTTGETVTISETAPASPWEFQTLTCVDGTGASIGTVSGRSVTFSSANVSAAATAAQSPITCTYVNRYTPKATLTLVKTITRNNQPAPQAAITDWTLKAQGRGAVSAQSISGVSASTAVTNQSVIAGTYDLSEIANNADTTAGYQGSAWSCTNGVTVTNGSITLANGTTTICTINNTYQVGNLAITKTVTSPTGGYTGGTSKTFTAAYTCTLGTRVVAGTVTISPNATNGTAGAPATVASIPAGATCVVTEQDAPTGTSTGLANTSFVWGSPSVSSTATIAAGGTATVNVGNPVTQNTGTLAITKQVQPRDAGYAAAFTNTTRTFAIDYRCVIGQTVTAQGTVNVVAGATANVTGIPSTSTCTTSEAAQTGADFIDASYRWDGSTITQAGTIPVANTVTASVVNFFTRDMVSLTIAKTVTGDGYSAGDTFDIDYVCGSTVSGTVTIASGESEPVSVPAGVACTVSEDTGSRPDLSGGSVWVDPMYEGLTNGTVTVPAGATRTVTVTNATKIAFGRVQVAKAIPDYASAVAPGTSFPITVSCDAPARGESENYSATFTFTAPVSGAQQTPFLPAGTSCTVTEHDQPTGSSQLADASYAWGEPTYDGLSEGAVVVPASATAPLVTVTNPISRVFGALNITKVVNNNTGATISSGFAGTWSCVYGTDDALTGGWSVSASGGDATLTGDTGGILVGSTCTITENTLDPVAPGDASYVWTQNVPAPVTVGSGGAQATVTNTLDRTEGSIVIAKNVVGGTAGVEFAATDFVFSYTCTPDSGPEISGTVSVPAGGSASPDEEIPAGSDCTVTEDTAALPAPVDPNRWTGVTFDTTGAAGTSISNGVTFTTPADADTVQVTATNTIAAQTGTVQATKSLVDPDHGFTGSGDLFPLTLSCVVPGSETATTYATKNVAVDGTVSWDEIPLGSDCSVAEGEIAAGALADASFTWGAVTYSAETVHLNDGEKPTLTVTNTIARVYGEIDVVKVVDSGGFSGVLDPAATFSGTWTCTYGGETVASGTWSGTGSAAGTVATLTGSRDEIPLTAECGATEGDPAAPSADASFHWAEPEITGVDSLTSTEGTITVRNTLQRDVTSLTVSKTLSGHTEGYAPGDDAGFAVGAVCALDPDDIGNAEAEARMAAQVIVQADAEATTLISGVPQGWSCAVNEAAPQGQLADDSFSWGAPEYTLDGAELTGTFVPAAGGQKVQVTNPIVQRTGGLTITKAFDAVPTGVVNTTATFGGTYTCVYAEGTDRERTDSGTWSVTGAGTAALQAAEGSADATDALPFGTECSVTEDDPAADALANASWAWNAARIDESNATVTADSDASVTVTNSVHRVYAALEVTKVYDGEDGAFADDLTVSGTWRCELDGDVTSGAWTLPALGGSTTVATAEDALIAADATCEITENTLDDSNLTDASFAWDAPEFSAAVTTSVDETANLTVTNSTHRVTGTFTVSKDVNRGALVPEAVPSSDRVYSGDYVCTYGGETVAEGSWSTTAGTSWTLPEGVYVGSSCAVTGEDDPGAVSPVDSSFQWAGTVIGAPVEIAATTAKDIVVTNSVARVTGSFGVTKAVAGDTSGLPIGPGYDYTFTWQCTAADGTLVPETPGEFTIAAGATWSAPEDEVPAGSTCVVTETDMPAPTDASYTWSTEMSVTGGEDPTPGTSITFTVGDEIPSLVTATNTLSRTMGAFSVAKTSDPATGTTVMPGQDIHYTITVTGGSEGFVDDVVVTDALTSVLAEAALDDDSIAVSQGSVSRTTDKLVWSVGRVAADAELTMTYTVTVDDDAWGATLRNVVTATGEVPPPDCEDCTTVHYTPAWTLEKTSDPGSGSTVVAGDVISYTLTARNVSEDATMLGAVATDDVSGVTEYATLGDLPDGVTRTGDTLTWTIPDLAPGESTSVTYTAQVAAGHDGVTLRNTVAPGPGGSCVNDCTTEHHTPEWTVTKTSDPASGSAVKVGDTITYTLTAGNAGDVPVTDATVIDDMSSVLEHASLVGDLADGLTLDGTALTWDLPDIPVDGTVTVQYSVKVDEDALGTTLRNAITAEGPGGSCVESCSTVHYVPAWTLAKTSDPASGTTVEGGDTITYTLTAANPSDVTVTGALGVDDLSEVLSRATLGDLPDGVTRDGTTLTWAIPDLEPGESVSVSYTVTVKDGLTGQTITNTVRPAGADGGQCVNACTTSHPLPPTPVVVPPALSVTGQVAIGGGVIAVMALLIGGGVILVLRSRRRHSL